MSEFQRIWIVKNQEVFEWMQIGSVWFERITAMNYQSLKVGQVNGCTCSSLGFLHGTLFSVTDEAVATANSLLKGKLRL